MVLLPSGFALLGHPKSLPDSLPHSATFRFQGHCHPVAHTTNVRAVTLSTTRLAYGTETVGDDIQWTTLVPAY